MKAIPRRMLAYRLALLICGGYLTLALFGAGRAKTDNLEISAIAMPAAGDQVELQIDWRWSPSPQGADCLQREQLLAVSFDTRHLVFEGEEAPVEDGAVGEVFRFLEERVGLDGSRRLFVIPAGKNGRMRVWFRSKWPGDQSRSAHFWIYVVERDGWDSFRIDRQISVPTPGRGLEP